MAAIISEVLRAEPPTLTHEISPISTSTGIRLNRRELIQGSTKLVFTGLGALIIGADILDASQNQIQDSQEYIKNATPLDSPSTEAFVEDQGLRLAGAKESQRNSRALITTGLLMVIGGLENRRRNQEIKDKNTLQQPEVEVFPNK